MKYDVHLETSYLDKFIVEAQSEEDAKDKAMELYSEGVVGERLKFSDEVNCSNIAPADDDAKLTYPED